VEHAWCRDPSRDEAVRAAEDGRAKPMPTLGEAIARPFSEAAERSVPVSKTGEGQSGMRTERVVIEIEHSGTEPINLDNLGLHLRTRLGLFVGLRRINESVRVVDQAVGSVDDRAYADRIGCDEERDFANRILDERDAATRERDKLRGEITSVLDRAEQVRSEHDALRARVAELEAASGGGDGEPDYYVYKNELGMIVYTSQKLVNDGWGGCTIEPVYKEPSQPRGCLTQHEIAALTGCCVSSGNLNEEGKKTIRNLLARSSPPDVVLPPMVIAYDDRWRGCEGGGK
jgi:hypothetical protein